MAQQGNWTELLSTLDSSDLETAERVRELLQSSLSNERGPGLLNCLMDYYITSQSKEALKMLCAVREPHDKHLLERLNDCLGRSAARLPSLLLLWHLMHKQPSWIHKLPKAPVFLSFLKLLKTDTDVVVLTTGVLVLSTLLPMIPQSIKNCLYDIFDIFSRLASWGIKNPAGQVPDVCLVHLHAGVYTLFHRLYGMYPCNFLSYLRAHYGMRENCALFQEVVLPMLERVRVHPELVTGTKEYEMDASKWKRYETQDVVIECAKVSLDPKEASTEESYSSTHELFGTNCLPCFTPDSSIHIGHVRASSPLASNAHVPLSQCLCVNQDAISGQMTTESVEVTWSPSLECGLSTPPPSRGMSPSQLHSDGAQHSTPRPECETPSYNPTISPGPLHLDDFTKDLLLEESKLHKLTEDTDASFFNVHSRDGSFTSSATENCNERIPGSNENSKDALVDGPGTVSLRELPQVIHGLDQQTSAAEQEQEDAAINMEISEIYRGVHDEISTRGVFDSPFCPNELTRPVPATPMPSASDLHRRHDVQRATNTLETCNKPSSFLPIDNPSFAVNGMDGHSEESTTLPAARTSTVLTSSQLSTPSGLTCDANVSTALSSLCTFPYELLFASALPWTAASFIDKKIVESQSLWESGQELCNHTSDVSPSPLDVLDVLIQRGGDVHAKELKWLPLPCQAADWTHFGGEAPAEEMQVMRARLKLLHAQLLYERHKREQHALRNRRLLRRVIKATALQEYNTAMKDQLNTQEEELRGLKMSLVEEQARVRRVHLDQERAVAFYQGQLRTLQTDRDSLSASNRELQSMLDETYRETQRLTTELQKANNTVFNTNNDLRHLQDKLKLGQEAQDQAEMLNRQLLMLGELNEFCRAELNTAQPCLTKESVMCLDARFQELEQLRHVSRQQLEAATRRISELDAGLAAKELLIHQQKELLETAKIQAREQLKSVESKYQAQKRVVQALERHLLDLYSKLDNRKEQVIAVNAGVARDEPFLNQGAIGGTHVRNLPDVTTRQGIMDYDGV
uniref:hamartin n=1 Tax=Myxine glutinosa TaxID=7769 RepID=UPI00358E340A